MPGRCCNFKERRKSQRFLIKNRARSCASSSLQMGKKKEGKQRRRASKLVFISFYLFDFNQKSTNFCISWNGWKKEENLFDSNRHRSNVCESSRLIRFFQFLMKMKKKNVNHIQNLYFSNSKKNRKAEKMKAKETNLWWRSKDISININDEWTASLFEQQKQQIIKWQ